MRDQAIAAFGKVELWVAWLDPCSCFFCLAQSQHGTADLPSTSDIEHFILLDLGTFLTEPTNSCLVWAINCTEFGPYLLSQGHYYARGYPAAARLLVLRQTRLIWSLFTCTLPLVGSIIRRFI
jgi:hypothetical protein